MLSDVDIYRAAHLMMHEHGDGAELEAATQADRMFRRGDQSELLTWFRIWRTIAVMRQAPTGLITLTGNASVGDEGLQRQVAFPQYQRPAEVCAAR